MALPPIIKFPNLLLKKISLPVIKFDSRLSRVVSNMVKAMRKDLGIGLAAVQIGKLQRIVIAEFDTKKFDEDLPSIPLTVLVNPKIVKASKIKTVMEEGCLSFPRLELAIERPEAVEIEAQDVKGKKIKLTADGLLSRILQHEIDHLDGMILTQKAQPEAYRVVFMGTPAYSLPTLETIKKMGLTVPLVVSETDKPLGRTKKLKPPAVKEWALKNEIPVYQPESLKTEQALIPIENARPHFIVLISYGKILPKEFLDIPPLGALNLHGSILPKLRGASPIQNAILQGLEKTGVTLMIMNEKMDEGEIVATKALNIEKDDNARSLGEKMSALSSQLLKEALLPYLKDELIPQKQNHKQASYTKLLKKEDGEIDWRKSAQEIERQIRAYCVWPKSYTIISGRRLIIHKTKLVDEKLVLEEVQIEGKKPMKFDQFIRGNQKMLTEFQKIDKIKIE